MVHKWHKLSCPVLILLSSKKRAIYENSATDEKVLKLGKICGKLGSKIIGG